MTRKIYEKKIYTTRPNQLGRKVYDRANNVLPIYTGKYGVKSVALVAGGAGYSVDEELTIPGAAGDTPAVITVKTVSAAKHAVATATAAGTMSGYVTDETITIPGAAGDTPAVLTITAVDGAITSLTVTEAGSFASDIAGSVTSFEYEGEGTGLELSVTTSEVAGGAVLTFEFTEGEYATNISGEYTIAGTTGTGAKFDVTAKKLIAE